MGRRGAVLAWVGVLRTMAVLEERVPDRFPQAGLTRRTVAVGLAGLVGLGVSRADARQATPPASGTRSVETIHGAVDVPINPQRVVALTYISSIAAAELGVMPVGVTRWIPELPPGFPDMASVAKIENTSYDLDIEAIIALEPDLILGSDVLDSADQQLPFDHLSRIAPTALFEWVRGGANWAAEAAGCAQALGKEDEFAELRAGYDQKAEQVKETYTEELTALTFDFLDAGESEWYLHGPASTHCKVAIDAGVTLGAGAALDDAFTGYSFEQLNVLTDTGALVVRAAPDPSLAILRALPTFTTLPAVTADRVLTTGYFYVASYAQCDALLNDLATGLGSLTVS